MGDCLSDALTIPIVIGRVKNYAHTFRKYSWKSFLDEERVTKPSIGATVERLLEWRGFLPWPDDGNRSYLDSQTTSIGLLSSSNRLIASIASDSVV